MTAVREVPFFRYPALFTDHEEAFLRIIKDVGHRGAFIMQRDLEACERKLEAFTGIRHAIGVANATDALEILVQAAGIGSGDEVILCSHTMLATASAVVMNGATPVPVDPGADHLLDPAAVERAITPRTKAVLPTQLNGRTCDMDAIRAVAQKHDLLILEDAAQALGSRFRGTHAGGFGLGGCISFYPAKVLGCLGDGGAVLTNDPEMARTVYQLRDHGRDHETGEVCRWGRNSRLDNLQAALISFQLDTYTETMARRRALASLYQAGLGDLPEVTLPPTPDTGAHFDVFQNYEIEADRRDALQTFLKDRGIGTLIQWGGTAVHQFRQLGFTQACPYTDALFKRMIMLPMNLSLTEDEVAYVCDAVRAFYRG